MQGKVDGWVLDGGGACRKRGGKVELTDRPYGDRLSPTGAVLLRSALTNAVGGDAGKGAPRPMIKYLVSHTRTRRRSPGVAPNNCLDSTETT
ncbi:hypothetical protein EYF80_015102 [Liparis tanakae]|uniref:Uncharacterized protein n=1 Tax=Liparis tanakae TaxID=230148 RepID=A0A4Z2IAX0_9TELE|nr:hypothetical protein EYF80_015102 [Liparis tanakae]